MPWQLIRWFQVREINCLPRGKVSEAWQLEDSAFLLDFLLEACSDKALKRRTFGALRAMERSSARRIQSWWRGKAHCSPEVPQCASRFEVLSEEIPAPFPEVKEASEASSQPRVQILILDTPSPEVQTDMPAVRLDLAEVVQDKPPAVDAAKSPRQLPVATGQAEETPEDALEAPPNPEPEAQMEPEKKSEEEGSEQERLQALWLQLQQGQREWQQRQAGVEGELAAPKAPKVTSYPAAPAQPAPPRPPVRLADSTEEAPRRPAALTALPVTTDLVLAGPTEHSTPGSSPGGLDLSKGKASKGEHMYRRKWNPRIAMEQRKEREKQRPVANPPRPAPASGAPQARGEEEVKHCSHDDPMAAECGSASTAGLSLGAPTDLGPEPRVAPEPAMQPPSTEVLGPARLNRHPPDEDPGLEDLDFARLQKMISDTMASADAEIAGSEVGAADAGASRSVGLSLGAPGWPTYRSWQLGGAGGLAAFPCIQGSSKPMPKKETMLVGKALFGRQRFAFEVQEVNRTPAAVRKLLDKAKAMEDERFGPCDFFGERDENKPKQELSIFDVVRAGELAAKHSIQVKFQDIDRIDIVGNEVTLNLSKAPACYVKPEGEMAIVNMEVAKDITGGAKSLKFTTGTSGQESFLRMKGKNAETVSFPEVRRLVSQCSPRMDALFRGLPPPRPVAAPSRKRKTSDAAVAEKKPRIAPAQLQEEIAAAEGTWLKRAVDRFQLKGIVGTASEAHWKTYFGERVLLEMKREASVAADEDSSDEAQDEDAVAWPECLGAQPEIHGFDFESYRDGEEKEFAQEVLAGIQSSVEATIKSSALKLDASAFAGGVFLLSYHLNMDDDDPRTVDAHARIYAPNASGNFLDLRYHNHHRVRMSFTERDSHLYVVRGGPDVAPAARKQGRQEGEKIFDLDFNEYRRKNQVKTSLATNATLASLGAHLFGAEGVLSNRKVFGLLVRSVGLGQFGERNGWPIATARRRFKCGKGETETDTESIPGDKHEEANVGDCCVM